MEDKSDPGGLFCSLCQNSQEIDSKSDTGMSYLLSNICMLQQVSAGQNQAGWEKSGLTAACRTQQGDEKEYMHVLTVEQDRLAMCR